MDNKKTVRPGEIYRHYKGNLYQVVAIGEYTETKETMVVYQALYGQFKIYIRSYEEFISNIDRERNPFIEQEERFQLQNFLEENTEENDKIINEEKSDIKRDVYEVFMEFLDAKTYEKKLELLLQMEKQLDDRLLNNLAVCLDLPIQEGTLEERFETLKYNLQLYAKFECKKLR